MKILFLSITYNLEIVNLYTELVDELLENNHSVTIISSVSNDKIISTNYRIYGFNCGIIGEKNIIKKGIDTLIIGNRFKNIVKTKLYDQEFDLIMYATPPITLNNVIKFTRKFYKSKTLLMLKDIFPQNAVDLNMFTKKNPIYWYFRHREIQLYKNSDFIGCMSKGNIDYVLKHNPYLNKEKVHLFCNAIKINKNKYKYIIKNYSGITTFIFGGNLGEPQNIAGLLNVISKLNNYPLAKFIIVGKGANDHLIKEYIGNNIVHNLKYYNFIPKKEYDQILKEADVGLINLDPRFTIPNIPSKLVSYMNLHKPVLAITDINTDLKDIIEESSCGWWCDATNQESIISTIESICKNKNEQIEKGNNGYKYLCQNYDVKINVKQIEDFMEE